MSSDPHSQPAHHEPLDLDPVRTLPADEAASPTWLPILGAILALVGITAWAVGRSPTPSSVEPGVSAAPVTALGAGSARADAASKPQRQDPTASAGPNRRLTPEQLERLDRHREDALWQGAKAQERSKRPEPK
jgi:hypothetical protein